MKLTQETIEDLVDLIFELNLEDFQDYLELFKKLNFTFADGNSSQSLLEIRNIT